MKKLQSVLDWFPHWIFVGLSMFGAAFLQSLEGDSNLFSELLAGDKAALWTDAKTALFVGAAALLGYLKTDPWTTAQLKAAAARKAPTVPPMAILCFFAFAFLLSACISVNPTVPVTPDNKAKIDSCTSTGLVHNDFVLGGIVTGGLAAGAGGVAAAVPDNKGLQQTMAVTAAGGALLAGIAAGGAGFTAAAFTNNRCTDVVTPLPMKPNPSGSALPSFSEM